MKQSQENCLFLLLFDLRVMGEVACIDFNAQSIHPYISRDGFFVGSLKNDGKGKYDRSSFQEQPETRFCIFVVMPETALHILAGITCKVHFLRTMAAGKSHRSPFFTVTPETEQTYIRA